LDELVAATVTEKEKPNTFSTLRSSFFCRKEIKQNETGRSFACSPAMPLAGRYVVLAMGRKDKIKDNINRNAESPVIDVCEREEMT
jgi:hypothetical protein